MTITIVYSSVDGGWTTRKFKTLKGARAFAHKWVGGHPEIGSSYAVSGDGIGKVTVQGATLAELFPAAAGNDGGPEEYMGWPVSEGTEA